MKYDKNILNEIANHIDVLNTINGGVSMTFLNIVSEEDRFIISVKTPGISKYTYRVELINNMIFIYTLIKIRKEDSVVEIPSFMKYIPVPDFVETDDISAVFENDELKVLVPFSDQKNFKQRKIKIDYL